MACGVPQKCPDRYAGVIRLYIVLMLFPMIVLSAMCLLTYGLTAAVLPSVVSAAGVWAAFCLPDMYVDRVSYTRHRDWLMIEKGVLWRRSVLVPRRQIQYVKLRRGPIERIFHLSGIVIVTSGGRVALHGLEPDDARRLHSVIESGMRE